MTNTGYYVRNLRYPECGANLNQNAKRISETRRTINREIAKLNYRIHTGAIKDNLIPSELTPEQISYKYANEADLLNVALFGRTAKHEKL